MDMDACATCRFKFNSTNPANLGNVEMLCRRYPPEVTPIMGILNGAPTQLGKTTNYPNVTADWWCGEYKPTIELTH